VTCGPRSRARPGPVLAVMLLALLTALGCASSSEASLTVFGAASLRDVLVGLKAAWEARHPEWPLVVATEGSNVLAAQIEAGAPADVFLSADTTQPAWLFDRGLAAGEPFTFARNTVALAAPNGDERVTTVTDLALPGVRLVAAGPGVPITRYADETLERIAAGMPDPTAFRAAVEANIVSREDNVRAALAKVELGEADAAFVYRTDAASSDLVRVVPLPPGSATAADYGAVAVSASQGAAAFLDWLRGAEAQDILVAAGFLPPDSEPDA
jgi:molybdate transport system substrate-binding protein